MTGLSEDQIMDYREVFNLFDSKGDGKIYAHQLGEVLRAMGQNPTEAEVKKCGYSQEPDKRIAFDAVLPIVANMSKTRVVPVMDDFIEGFKVFDKEQNGTINSAELRHLLTNLGEKMSDEEVNELLQGYEDSHGNIVYEDFIKSILTS